MCRIGHHSGLSTGSVAVIWTVTWGLFFFGGASLVGCRVDIDYGNSRFLCEKSVCPDQFECVSGQCVSMSSLDAAISSPDGNRHCGDNFCTEECGACNADCGACVDGLLVRWTFDGSGATVVDVSSGKRDGVLLDGTRIDSPRGRALLLNGMSGGVIRKDVTELAVPQVSLAAWVRAPMSSTRRELISFGDVYALRLTRVGQASFFAWGHPPGLPDADWYAADSDANARRFDDDQWHHWVGRFANTELELFVDGQKVATTLFSDIDYPSLLGRDLVVGQHGNGETGFAFNGEIDDVQVFERALSDSEVAGMASQ